MSPNFRAQIDERPSRSPTVTPSVPVCAAAVPVRAARRASARRRRASPRRANHRRGSSRRDSTPAMPAAAAVIPAGPRHKILAPRRPRRPTLAVRNTRAVDVTVVSVSASTCSQSNSRIRVVRRRGRHRRGRSGKQCRNGGYRSPGSNSHQNPPVEVLVVISENAWLLRIVPVKSQTDEPAATLRDAGL